MLRAFFDESGKHEHARIFTIAGYVAKVSQWARLGSKWKMALSEEGLTEFHMTDCEGGYGEFKGFSRTKRDGLQMKFIDLILEADLIGTGTAIVRRHYENVLPVLRRNPKYRYLYFLAFENSISDMMHRTKGRYPHERISVVFDAQKEFSGRAKELFDEIKKLDVEDIPYLARIGGLTFEDSKQTVQLQTADILAYEVNRFLAETKRGIKQKRWQMEMLERGSINGKLYEKNGLAALVEEIRNSREVQQ